MNRRHPHSNVGHDTIAITAALPARAAAWVLDYSMPSGSGQRIKTRLEEVPTGAYPLTVPVWPLVIWRGILYPAFAAKNLDASCGGPTLAGARAGALCNHDWRVAHLVGRDSCRQKRPFRSNPSYSTNAPMYQSGTPRTRTEDTPCDVS
jgi:hypothetical protein